MSDTVLSETTAAEKKPRKYTKPTQRRVGPECPHCKRPMPVADVPKDATPEDIAAKIARLNAQLEIAKGITVKKLEPAAPVAEVPKTEA